MFCPVREVCGQRGAEVAPAARRIHGLQVRHPFQDPGELPGSIIKLLTKNTILCCILIIEKIS